MFRCRDPNVVGARAGHHCLFKPTFKLAPSKREKCRGHPWERPFLCGIGMGIAQKQLLTPDAPATILTTKELQILLELSPAEGLLLIDS